MTGVLRQVKDKVLEMSGLVEESQHRVVTHQWAKIGKFCQLLPICEGAIAFTFIKAANQEAKCAEVEIGNTDILVEVGIQSELNLPDDA